jgi:hypothetical protein
MIENACPRGAHPVPNSSFDRISPIGWVLTFNRISKYKSDNLMAPVDFKYIDKITDSSTQTVSGVLHDTRLR